MYLGDRWEHLFRIGEPRLRAYGAGPLAAGSHWLEVPRQSFWVF
jgi:iron(III) transport system ATP-binding protein